MHQIPVTKNLGLVLKYILVTSERWADFDLFERWWTAQSCLKRLLTLRSGECNAFRYVQLESVLFNYDVESADKPQGNGWVESKFKRLCRIVK